jgi:multicomponent Na+:H+ antiporter subunit D
MPWTTGFCIVGAASISAFPLFSGFVSKSIVMAEVANQGYLSVWLILLFASAGVFHHAGIKIPFFAFFSHDSGIRCEEAPRNMLIAMGIGATVCIFNGVYPALLYSLLPYSMDYVPYTASHILQQMQLLFFSALAFTVLKLTGIYPPELRSVNLDVDWFYRRPLATIVRGVGSICGVIRDGVIDTGKSLVGLVVAVLHFGHGPSGVAARTLLSSTAIAIVIVLLFVLLLRNYLTQ